jgi:pyruvate kinase
MIRRTKIVATLGPACSDAKTLDRMMEAGLDVVRLNFSHGTAQDHIDRAELVRSLARTRGRAVGVLVDLQGRKSASASSRTARSSWPRTILSFSTPPASWATRPASASTTRNCRTT